MNNPSKPHIRSLARECVFKAVFASRISGNEVEASIQTIIKEGDYIKVDKAFAENLLQICKIHLDEINCQLKPLVTLQATRNLNDVEYAVMLVGAAELLYKAETPPKVVINEYVNLSKKYGTEQGYRLVNAVLDQLYKSSQGLL